MTPVLILQHLDSDGPAYLGEWLARRGIAAEVRCTERGEPFPADLRDHSALAILGGAMSANDELPSLRRAEALVRTAIADGLPVIGHCLGGQLIARALGASVHASPAPEVGWHGVDWLPGAADWFGPGVADTPPAEVFQWHFEAFDLPAGAVPLGGSRACPHQAFSIGPSVLAMQFHVEQDSAKLDAWLDDLDGDYLAACQRHAASVQSPAEMRRGASQRLAAQQRLADAAYAQWWAAARR